MRGDADNRRPLAPGRRRAGHHRRQHLRPAALQAGEPPRAPCRRRAGYIAARAFPPRYPLPGTYT